VGEETVVGGASPESDATVVGDVPAQPMRPAPQPQPKPKPREQKPQPSYYSNHASATPKPAAKKNSMQWIIIAAVMAVCCGIGAVVYKLVVGSGSEVVEVKEPQTPTAQALQLLTGTDLTMNRIQEVEKDVKHNGTDEEEKKLKSRINALKHLYLEGLLADHRSVKGLYGIFIIHSGEFSQQQRDLMIWFFDQPEAVKQRWEQVTVKPQSLDEFKQMIEQGN
jgi:hypothetical protein